MELVREEMPLHAPRRVGSESPGTNRLCGTLLEKLIKFCRDIVPCSREMLTPPSRPRDAMMIHSLKRDLLAAIAAYASKRRNYVANISVQH